jgi:hypothetical protein
MVVQCSQDSQQSFIYDENTKAIINIKKKNNIQKPVQTTWFKERYKQLIVPDAKYLDANTTCLTASVTDSQKTSYGTLPKFQPCVAGDQTQKWLVNTAAGTITPATAAVSSLCLDYASRWQCDISDSLIYNLPFCNHNLTSEQRALDIVSRMTPEEKIQQLVHVAPAVTRLGVSHYNYWSEALHGVLDRVDTVTMFPQVIGLGATYNQRLYRAIGQVISTEGRALANQEIMGLTFWAPNINIFRDPVSIDLFILIIISAGEEVMKHLVKIHSYHQDMLPIL